MPYDSNGNWYDEENLSPWEQAHGGQTYDPGNTEANAPNAFDQATEEYYGGQNDNAGHPDTNWYQPDSYNWLINDTGGPGGGTTPPPPPPNGDPDPTGITYGGFTAPSRQGYPSLPGVPNAPTPNLPAWKTPPPFAYDAYAAAAPFSYQDFTAPSVDEALQDPSYQWRKQQGEQSLQRWAAAKGTLNDSGTAKSLLEYGGNAASQEYQNIWNRGLQTYGTNRGNALENFNVNEGNRFNAYNTNRAGAVQQYNTNYQTQYADPYKAAYQSAIDTWIPQQETWRAGVDMSRLGYTTQSGQVMHDNDQAYANAWNQYLTGYDQWRDLNFTIPTELAKL